MAAEKEAWGLGQGRARNWTLYQEKRKAMEQVESKARDWE